MYSVLFCDQNSIDEFFQFYPLFTETMAKKSIGICPWNEHGTDIESTAPGVYDLIDGKSEWQAIIVVQADENNSYEFKTKDQNPFDYLINSKASTCHESPVPLIRLTQMLGGVPSPTVHFESELIEEDGKMPRVVYNSRIDPDEKRTHKMLSEKNRFYGIPPTQIIVISKRIENDDAYALSNDAWGGRKEQSTFANSNAYPRNCRFLVYDLKRYGETKRTEELFEFWTTVVLLALNDLDSNVLKAYQLYKVDSVFDSEKMYDVFQKAADRAVGARMYFEKLLEKELNSKINGGKGIPNYKVAVPVNLDNPPETRTSVSYNMFHMTSPSYKEETSEFNKVHAESKRGLDTMNTWAERALDRSSEVVREVCTYDKHSVKPLGKYQMEDFNSSLSAVNDTIYAQRKVLPTGSVGDKQKLDKCAKTVREKILQRTTTTAAMNCFWFCALVVLASLVSGLFLTSRSGSASALPLLIVIAVSVILLGIIEYMTLSVQHMELKGWLAKYDELLGDACERIRANALCFSDYLSSVASYMKGNDYKKALDDEKTAKNEYWYKLKEQINTTESFIDDMKKWSFAFHLPVDFDSEAAHSKFDVLMEQTPFAEPLYTFESRTSYDVEVNESGETVKSPFGFVKCVSIKREELYDDAE